MNIIIILVFMLASLLSTFQADAVTSFCCTSTTAGQVFVSIYGEKEVEKTDDALSVQFQYGIPSLIITSTTVSGGTITTASSNAVLSTAGTAGAVAGLQSKTNLEYRSGHEAYAYFTVAFTGSIANNTKQYIGILDSSNGFGVGFNGTSFGVVVRNNGVDTFTSQSNFNGDTLNGSGSSEFNYTRTNLNVFRIAYGWLGASIITFQIMNSNGNWITFHTVRQPNSSNIPSIANPMLPISAQVFDSAGGNSLTLRTASWNMGIVAVESDVANRYFTVTNSAAIPNLTETHFLTIRNQSTFQSVPNKVNLTLAQYVGMITSDITPEFLMLRIYKNATVTGTSFSNVDTNNSVTQFSTAGTYTAATGIQLLASPLNSLGNPQWPFIHENQYNITVYPGETLTLTVQLLGGAETVLGSLAWSEGF